MKLLFDQNLSYKLCGLLADIFGGSQQVRLIGLDQAEDIAIWEYARSAGFVIVSQDADFAELATLHGPPPQVIWLRGGNQPSAEIAAQLRDHFEAIGCFGDSDAACLEIQ